MELTKDFVISCRKLNILRDFLCQAIDQVDEKDKEIEKLKAASVHTDNSAVIENMAAELEKLRPMETALEMAEANCKGYQARIKTLEAKNHQMGKSLWKARANFAKARKESFDHLWNIAPREKVGVTGSSHRTSFAKTLKEPKEWFKKFCEIENKLNTKIKKLEANK